MQNLSLAWCSPHCTVDKARLSHTHFADTSNPGLPVARSACFFQNQRPASEVVAISEMGKESEAKRALFSLCRGGNGERSVPVRACGTERASGKAGGECHCSLSCENSLFFIIFVHVTLFGLGMERNALPWLFAPGCVDSPRTAVVRSGQTVQNSFKGKDSQRRPSPRPALWGSPARREQNLQAPLLSCPGTPHGATGRSKKASWRPSFRPLWTTRL